MLNKGKILLKISDLKNELITLAMGENPTLTLKNILFKLEKVTFNNTPNSKT